jgi:hypothetical protein
MNKLALQIIEINKCQVLHVHQKIEKDLLAESIVTLLPLDDLVWFHA